MNNDELGLLADPTFEQYFLVSPEKLTLIFDAAGIRPEDKVLEVGAGAGTVARHMPPCQSLTVVELDTRLTELLRQAVPHATVLQGDALRLVRELPHDVLIGNLPNVVTESLIDVLPGLPFRTAVLATGHTNFDHLRPTFEVSEVTTISGSDFTPPQPSVSRVVKLARRDG
ncbi:rRNA adenine N-6-methyltransferase family protein [Amycolatopsis cihanbeyliensis]|uniref:Ribosomal RNA adenine dimethylase n=1 Tax=Amycolatopsis cihanbeyliensis TaxID=1128664 RepID=A0A542DJS1_AMYCI|nr:rRNA adenine N-6-methyltransferase family protein [Amycolatopsis cihanbeyliensis]TQJ03254.1 ribosomal RNA adenine dimethylase [Amycolatopsis cihanbeyliensis]